jgi:hypothetical protein
MGSRGTQRGVKSQIANLIAFRKAGLDVPAALAIRFGSRTTTGLFAGQPVKLSIKTPGSKLLGTCNLLAPLPPVGIVGCLGDRLGAGLLLGDLGPVGDLIILA